ncbi:hypothetical protein P3T37_006954 [Kitasatospora sp. MAA4]|uniref:hypothetical protein n=1 Tax=Kitasatospora sp. MAA4 TaxID=3035093 RepID=UPI00247308CA|nr:hypothetical protein [Kitasatospora sp. MAA4]MDH6137521.1 hypothetical protein [Kitasatospora sp. MAA4]
MTDQRESIELGEEHRQFYRTLPTPFWGGVAESRPAPRVAAVAQPRSSAPSPVFGWSLERSYDEPAASMDLARITGQLRAMTRDGLGSADLSEALELIAVMTVIVQRVERHTRDGAS